MLGLKVNDQNFVTIETHFGVPGHFIRATTRNKCSEDIVAMLQETARILYPNEDFEVFLLPPEPGSYRDIIKFVKKNKLGTSATAIVAVGGLALGFLNYKDSHESHVQSQKMEIISDTAKCLELAKTLDILRNDYVIENIPDAKIAEVCGSLTLKKKKNAIFTTLQGDNMIESNETSLKGSDGKILLSENIDKKDFKNYIEPVLDQKLSMENLVGTVELISPVVKQKKEGKGIPWRGVYYGEDIKVGSLTILKNGEDVEFYMQDSELKSQIYNRQRTFASGDNMKILFDMRGDMKADTLQNRSIYIREVQSYNEEVIPHKEKILKNRNSELEGQIGLFGDQE